jgi:O-antigen/teichoic acid export membrane protein
MPRSEPPQAVAKREDHRPWLQIVVQNFSATMTSSVADSVLRFVAYGYLARQLGPEVFGVNSFMYTTTVFFGSLSDFGLRILAARDIASHPERMERQVGTILALKLALATLTYGLMLLFVVLTREAAEVRWLAAIYGLSLFAFNMGDWILIGLEQMHYLGVARIINGVGVFALVFALVRGPQDLLLVGAIESLTFLLASGYLLYVASTKVRIRLIFQLSEWWVLLREAFPLGISMIMIRLSHTLPVLSLGLLASDRAAGIYKAVSLLPTFAEQSNMLLGDALFPTFSRIYAQSAQRFSRLVSLVQKYLAITGVFVSALGILIVGPLLISVFGKEFQEGLSTFSVLMVVSAVSFSNLIVRKLLPACHAQRRYAIIMTSRTGILLVLSLLLARRGSYGQAWAVLGAEFTALGLSLAFFRAQFHESPLLSSLLRVGVSAAAFALTAWGLRSNAILAMLAGSSVYALVLLLSRTLSREDLRTWVAIRGARES